MEAWVLFAIAAAAAQTLRFALQKVLTGGALSPAAATWARFLWSWPIAILLALLWGIWTGAERPTLTPAFLLWGMAGGLFQILATICTVSLFRLRAFAVGITFKKTEVMLTALVGFVLLGDRLSAAGVAAIAAGFFGVILLSGPPGGGSLLNRAAGIGLLSGVFFALSAVCYRGATLALDTGDPVLTGGVTLSVVALWQTVALGVWLAWREPGQIRATLAAWRTTSLVSVFSLMGSWSWFAAFSLMNAAYVFAVGQVELIFSLLVGWLWFREPLKARELLGMAVLTASILGVTALVG
ncbi:DMT family transporter [Silicimonas algicola]|uniref:EamA-like transporter family protein n=1 Tax=Silicimonas algicola TaxID=1826607 RepID=A0A316GD95_9RHOB|nr:DMT family transporter [Silicimonas algicola]AZQ66352.1 DMT family transporter [Silicimonas algicola]PWK58682.1 EamA-like transporter family protein [Silicimonas algicola]